ncbi:hypothetical protein SE336_20795 [Xanthomonas arboricola]|uniref:hypothetical protein n=1 Tax=Xanthomonas arboricola TaxID=56448 RepID=UPI0039F5EC3B
MPIALKSVRTAQSPLRIAADQRSAQCRRNITTCTPATSQVGYPRRLDLPQERSTA